MQTKDVTQFISNNVIIQGDSIIGNLYIDDEYFLIISDNIFDVIYQFFIVDDKARYKLNIKSKSTNATNETLTSAARMFLNEFKQSSFANGMYMQHIRLNTLPYVFNNKIFRDNCDDIIMRATVFFCIKIIAAICRELIPAVEEKHMRCSLLSDRSYRFNVYIKEEILKDFCSKREYIDFNMLNCGVYTTVDFVGEILYEKIIPAYYIYLGAISEKIKINPDLMYLDKFEITAYGDIT